MKEPCQQDVKNESENGEVNSNQSRSLDNVSGVTEGAVVVATVATTTIVIGDATAVKPSARAPEIALYEELHVRNDRLI